MAKRVCWKKGMRLTDDILRASDNSMIEYVSNAFALASAGRFGLLPSPTPFETSLNIAKGLVDVELLNCLAITKGGDLIDAHYDTKFTNTFDTHIAIPDNTGEKEYILVVNSHTEQWQDTNDGYETPVYSFSLLSVNSPVPQNAFPIAHIVDEYGWRMDDVDFVPPCLFITSHPKYLELQKKFSEVLSEIDGKAKGLIHSNGKDAIRIFWPVIQQLMITVNKEYDLMTPMELMANVQKCVSAFICACELDDYLNLADADKFKSYVNAPYNYKDCYQRICEGLDLCFAINDKVEKIGENAQPQVATHSVVTAPIVGSEDLFQDCATSETTINIMYDVLEANIYFTIDGKEPSNRSERAIKTRNGFKIKFDNEFRKEKGKEPDKTKTLKLIAVVDGVNSEVSCYSVSLHKSLKFRNAIPI